VSNRLNEVMKVLTVITAIFASLAVISGIYGMNFERAFPPFAWKYGFVAALGIMAASVAAMLAFFRRLRWL
jgi:magnesium transporter